jgi:hypothetical protein
MVQINPERYRVALPEGMEPGPKSGTSTHHRPGRTVLSCLAGALLMLASLLTGSPADAASVWLCAPPTGAGAAAGPLAALNLSTSYTTNSNGCVRAVGVLRRSLITDGLKPRP